ncbi:hydroxyisourate hydrolase, partial [Frankia sp. CpI1-P]
MGLSTHVLDTAQGRPAAGMPVRLERGASRSNSAQTGTGWTVVTEAVTDADGRIGGLPLT